jgi:uncharacterized membrane protein
MSSGCFASLGIAQNDMGGILLALAVAGWDKYFFIINRRSEVRKFSQIESPSHLTTEILFFIAFAFLAFVRSANPELASTEKPMELAFINGILRSKHSRRKMPGFRAMPFLIITSAM